MQVEVVADHPRPELVMHWAVEDWRLPARGVWPPGTVQAGDGAVQTPFQGGQSVKLLFPEVRWAAWLPAFLATVACLAWLATCPAALVGRPAF